MHFKGCTINCQQWLNLKGVIRELSFPLQSVNILHILYQLKCMNAAAAAKSLQLCLTLCDPTGGSPAHQAPLSLGFSRQEYWSGLPFPSPKCMNKSHQIAKHNTLSNYK